MSIVNRNQLEVRLAKDEEEIFEVQKLRYKVFVDEFGAKVSHQNKNECIESDKFDNHCDHLILIDKSTRTLVGKPIIVGTLRLLNSANAKKFYGFYSAAEYNLEKILNLKQNLLEIGRACVHKNYRGHIALHLLWLGLGKYVLKQDIKIIFGVASFNGSDPALFSSALSLLNHKYRASKELEFKALAPNSVDMNMISVHELDYTKAMLQMPSLIKAYLRMGAEVGEGAFVDTNFNTVDIGIMIKVELMNSKYKELYGRWEKISL